jgi:hypothetical protein
VEALCESSHMVSHGVYSRLVVDVPCDMFHWFPSYAVPQAVKCRFLDSGTFR